MNKEQLQSPDPSFVLRGVSSPVTSILFMTCDGSKQKSTSIVAGTQTGQLAFWDLRTKIVQQHNGHSNCSILWLGSLSSDQLLSQGRNDCVKLWNIGTCAPVLLSQYTIENYLGFSHCDLSRNNNEQLLAVPGPGQQCVTIWDLKSHTEVCSLTPKNLDKCGSLMQVKWISCRDDKNYLLTLHESGHMSVWDWSNRSVLGDICINENPVCCEYDDSLCQGIVGTVSEKVFVFTFDGESLNINRQYNVMNAGLSAIVSRPDGKLYALGGWDSRIRIYSWKKHKPLAVLQYHKKTVECLAYSTIQSSVENGYLLAAGSSDQSVSVWNIFNN